MRKSLGKREIIHRLDTKTSKSDLIKFKTSCSVKYSVKNLEKQIKTGRKYKYLQIIYMTKNFYLEYIKNSKSSTVKEPTKQYNYKMVKGHKQICQKRRYRNDI